MTVVLDIGKVKFGRDSKRRLNLSTISFDHNILKIC